MAASISFACKQLRQCLHCACELGIAARFAQAKECTEEDAKPGEFPFLKLSSSLARHLGRIELDWGGIPGRVSAAGGLWQMSERKRR